MKNIKERKDEVKRIKDRWLLKILRMKIKDRVKLNERIWRRIEDGMIGNKNNKEEVKVMIMKNLR